MFGKNEIVGRKYFKDSPKDSLFVTSMFMTLQGEGPFRGETAFFIRLAKCNLACSFCDTFFDDGDWMTYTEIFEKIYKTIADFYDGYENIPSFAKNDLERWEKNKLVLVITGGEPSLQQNLATFLHHATNIFRATQIESNGILSLEDLPLDTILVISPKCIEKGGNAIRYIQPNKHALDRADCLKFVMEADPNSPYSNIPEWAHTWARTTGKSIFVSPMNIYNDQPKKSKELRAFGANRIEMEDRSTVDEVISFWEDGLLDMKVNQLNHEYTAKFCVKHGYIFNMQLHLFASLA